MKFLIILIATTSVVRGYRHARYYESEYKMPQRYPRYGPPFMEQHRSYRDSFRSHPQPYIDNDAIYHHPPQSSREERPYFSEVSQFSDHPPSSYFPNQDRQSYFKKPVTYRDQEPLLSYGNQQDIPYSSFPAALTDDGQRYRPEQTFKEQPRQPLSFAGHSNYLKFGNHALGFASVPIKSTPSDNNELLSPAPTAVSTASTAGEPDANTNVQSNTSKVLQSVTEMAQPIIATDPPKVDISTNNVDAPVPTAAVNIPAVNMPTSKPLIATPNIPTGSIPSKQESSVLTSSPPVIMMPPEMKRLPFGISLPLAGFASNAYIRGGTDVRYNHLLEESKGYQPFDFQQSTSPEVLGYMLPPQQISSPVKISLPSLPISSLSAPVPSHLQTIKYISPNIPKLTFINHGAIHPQTSLSLASAFPVSEFGQNTVQLGQIGQLDSQRQDVFQGIQGLQLDLDGFGGLGGINYGAQSSNSISKPTVLGIAKVGLSLPETSRSIIPTFTKIGFGQHLW